MQRDSPTDSASRLAAQFSSSSERLARATSCSDLPTRSFTSPIGRHISRRPTPPSSPFDRLPLRTPRRHRETMLVIEARDSNQAQAHITSFWSKVAADYEAHAGNVAEYGSPEYQAWLDALASALPDPPADVLDVACGTGYVALAAASLGHHVTAVDLAADMLDELV